MTTPVRGYFPGYFAIIVGLVSCIATVCYPSEVKHKVITTAALIIVVTAASMTRLRGAARCYKMTAVRSTDTIVLKADDHRVILLLWGWMLRWLKVMGRWYVMAMRV